MVKLGSFCGAFGLLRSNKNKRNTKKRLYIIPKPPSNSHANMCNNFKIGDSTSDSLTEQKAINLIDIETDIRADNVSSMTISPSVIDSEDMTATNAQITPYNNNKSDHQINILAKDILEEIIAKISDNDEKTESSKDKLPEGFDQTILAPKVFFNDDYNNHSKSLIMSPMTPIPMSLSTEKAMATIQKFSDNESTPTSSQEIIHSFIKQPNATLKLPKIETTNLITPRISKLQNMVEAVVSTNVRLMQNFEEFVEKYHLENIRLSPLQCIKKKTQIRKRSNSEKCTKRKKKLPQNKSMDIAIENYPRLNTAERAFRRRSFDIEKKKRMKMEKEKEIKSMKEFKKKQEKIKMDRLDQMRYKATPIKKYKPTHIKLPKRKLKIPKVGIYERGVQRMKNKEAYYAEIRRIRDLEMGINSPKVTKRRKRTTGIDMQMRRNGCESRLKVMQTLRLRQA